MRTVLYVLAEVIRCLAISVQAVVPESAAQMLDQLQIPADQRQFVHIAADYALQPGTAIDKPAGVFPRILADGESENAPANTAESAAG